MLFKAPRGTSDTLPEQQRYWRFFENIAQGLATTFGYDRIDTPIIEDHRLFVRGIGQITDIVEKETYTFEDRGGDLLTLRPEGTAPVCRAYLEHGMHNLPQPVRLYYICPVFRYERPQSGRYRQHHQFGIEVFGDGDSSIDAEVIEVGWRLLEAIGVKNISLKINSTGDSRCRPQYVEKLQAHYLGHVHQLCQDCRRRLEHNPLRLLDCKQDSCQPIIAEAPHSINYLCDECLKHWEDLLSHLADLSVQHDIDHRLVRGFDYYTRTVFEISPGHERKHNALVGGGRYDGLIEELGGRPTPGIGFGMGIERVITNLERYEVPVPYIQTPKVLVAHIGEEGKRAGIRLSSELRLAGISAILAPSTRGLRSQLRYAATIKATHAVILGDEELRNGVVTLRDLSRSEQQEIGLDHLTQMLLKM